MKIISYNICNGAHGKIEELIAFLNQESPDVVCIQEANGWHENDFELFHKVGSCTGLIHTTIGMGDTPHHLITLSRLEPFSGMSLSLGNHHMAVNTLVPLPSDHERSVVVWNVHLNPYDEKSRLFEVEALPYAEAPHSADRIIVMGDFNFLCPMDDYPNDMLDRLREHGITKFGDKRLAYDAYMAGRAALQAHIDANPKGKHGKHEYNLDEYGLTRELIEKRFAFYTGDGRWPIRWAMWPCAGTSTWDSA